MHSWNLNLTRRNLWKQWFKDLKMRREVVEGYFTQSIISRLDLFLSYSWTIFNLYCTDLQGELAIKRTSSVFAPSPPSQPPALVLPSLPPPSQPDNKQMYKSQQQLETRPSPRQSPLTIVNDLLRKVGVLESKLATYNRDHSLRRKLHNKEFIKWLPTVSNVMLCAP